MRQQADDTARDPLSFRVTPLSRHMSECSGITQDRDPGDLIVRGVGTDAQEPQKVRETQRLPN